MKRPLGILLLLAGMAGGCQSPNAAWSAGQSTAPRRGPVYMLVAYRTSMTQWRPHAGQPPDEEFDEFDAFDELEDQLVVELVEIADPLEGWNRLMFQVNDVVYVWVGRPVLQGYTAVVPKPIRVGIRNFFFNLTMPVRAVNCLLQARWEGADIELRRFGINTTVGILGVLDVAGNKYGLEMEEADLGQTLAVYGVGDGCYLVWPLLGPSTIRDSAGFGGDLLLNPLFYIRPFELAVGVGAVRRGNEASFTLQDYDLLRKEALDPYVAIRQAYVQHRQKVVREGRGRRGGQRGVSGVAFLAM